MDHAQVQLLQLPVPDLLVHHPQGLRRLGGNDDPPGVPVDPVAEGGGEGLLLVGRPLPLLVQVRLDVGDQRVHLLPAVGVDHHAGAFVQQQQIPVLIKDLQPGLDHPEKGVVRGGRVEKLVVDIELKHVPGLEPRVPLGGLPVEPHPLQPEIFLGQRGGEEGDRLVQPAVQPLAPVVGADGKFLQANASPQKIPPHARTGCGGIVSQRKPGRKAAYTERRNRRKASLPSPVRAYTPACSSTLANTSPVSFFTMSRALSAVIS